MQQLYIVFNILFSFLNEYPQFCNFHAVHGVNALSAMVTDQTSSTLHLSITPPFEEPLRYDGYRVRLGLGGVNSPVLQSFSVAKSACPDVWFRNLEPNILYNVEVEWYSGLDVSAPFSLVATTGNQQILAPVPCKILGYP